MESGVQASLADRAALVAAASIWYHEDVIEISRKCFSMKISVQWEKIVNKIENNIDALPLTILTKQHVQDLSVLVGKNIKQWVHNNYFLTISSEILCNLIRWNSKGVIDCIKTAERVIPHEASIVNRFRIACLNCLENYIFESWQDVKHHYLHENADIMESFEIRFWISYVNQSLNILMHEIQYIGNRDTLQFAFNLSVVNNNAIWVEHFLNKMEANQIPVVAYNKLKFILEMRMVFNYKMIPVLSRRLSDEMVNDLLHKYPRIFLVQFLEFPLTEHFLKIANQTRNVLSNEDFYNVIETIGHYLQDYAENRIYKNIFESFWKSSPDHCKNYVIQKCIDGSFLNRLGLLKHSSCIIKSIIQSSTSDQRKEMIFSYNGILFLGSLARKNRWGCFNLSIQELVGSEDRGNWINGLICSYQKIFKTRRFPSFTHAEFEKLVSILEKPKTT